MQTFPLKTASWLLVALSLALLSPAARAQSGGTLFKPATPHYQVHQALEVEAVPLVYLTGGYHVAVGYRYEKFRVRLSAINAGTYNSETDDKDSFKKIEANGSLGLFLGYNAWKNLEVYGILERQNFRIEQKATGERKNLPTATFGLGAGYQFFLGRTFYVQPAVHLYTRSEKNQTFSNGVKYGLPTTEFVPVLRVGARLWRQSK